MIIRDIIRNMRNGAIAGAASGLAQTMQHRRHYHHTYGPGAAPMYPMAPLTPTYTVTPPHQVPLQGAFAPPPAYVPPYGGVAPVGAIPAVPGASAPSLLRRDVTLFLDLCGPTEAGAAGQIGYFGGSPQPTGFGDLGYSGYGQPAYGTPVLGGARSPEWQQAIPPLKELVTRLQNVDNDGITLYTYSDDENLGRSMGTTVAPWRQGHVRHGQALEQSVYGFAPQGHTDTHLVLDRAFRDFFANRHRNRAAGRSGETFLFVTNGVPARGYELAQTIVNMTQQMRAQQIPDHELGIVFVVLGGDQRARDFATFLDNNLKAGTGGPGMGAAYDIVDAITLDEILAGGVTLEALLMGAIYG
jgi:hypothetical protein